MYIHKTKSIFRCWKELDISCVAKSFISDLMIFLTKNYFCVRCKNIQKHNQHFKLLFFIINLRFWHIRLNINKIYLSEQYLFGLLFARKPNQSIVTGFLLCFERNDSQTFKNRNCKEPHHMVRYRYNFLR